MNESGGVLEVRLADVEIDERFAAGHANIAPGPYIRLTVNDTGEGMTPEIMERIFEPFFTTKERTKGTGMGLSVVHGIVESHKGFITVYSKPNVGTSFNVYVPIVRNLSDSGGKGLYDRSVLAKGNERILLVDDEQAVVDYGKEILETLGYEVTSTTCSIEAFELFRKRPEDFDLVITDMTMPNMSGDRLAKEILRIRPGVPIIICTGFSTFVTREEAEGLGVKDFVSKPMLRWEIAHTIRKVLTR
jgi:CheY-like chemotaxis protein